MDGDPARRRAIKKELSPEIQPVGSRVTALTSIDLVELQMDVKHRMIVFDAADIDAESAFWAGLLGGTVVEDGTRWRNIWVDGEWQLGVQLAPNHVQPEWPDGTPQQVHFDFYVVGTEGLDAAHDEVIGLGGRLLKAADDRTAARGVQTYADPAGHPFCVCWLPAD